MLEPGPGFPGGGEHDDRADRVPRVQRNEQHLLEWQASPEQVGGSADEEPGADRERDVPERQQEEHRDEHEGSRQREAGAHLEACVRRGGIRQDQADDRDETRRARRREQEGQSTCGREKGAREEEARIEAPAARPLGLAFADGPDVPVDVRIEGRSRRSALGRNGRGRSRHAAKIGIPALLLDAREGRPAKDPWKE